MPAVGKKFLYAALGLFATIVAILGVWLPGIPTTFPLIVALWAFSKSNQHLYRWLRSVPILKQALREAERFEREKTIDWRVKLIAVGSAWISTLVVGIMSKSVILTVFVAASALACTAFMAYIPTKQLAVASADDDE